MNLRLQTSSLCATCYKEISATVEVRDDGVWIRKVCPAHGEQLAMVERDPLFYTYVQGLHSTNIYDGILIDVTRRCNLRCGVCFYPLEKHDPDGIYSVASIVDECRVNRRHAPFIFTGGEPTLHPEIETLIKEVSAFGGFELLTNGVKLAEPEFYDRIMPLITFNGVANLNLSIHSKETDAWLTVLEQCRKDAIKVESALIVIDSKESFMIALGVCEAYKDVVQGFRIKSATRLWHEQKPTERIFCSDMLGWLEEFGYEPKFMLDRHNKVVFVNLLCKGNLFLMLVSWNDVENVDLEHIQCGPFYRARNGEVCNFVTASLINEGISHGWQKGIRIAVQRAGEVADLRHPETRRRYNPVSSLVVGPNPQSQTGSTGINAAIPSQS